MANIIVADDDVAVRSVIKRILVGDGHAVREAESGTVAMELMRDEPAELIISDVYMAGMDGIEALIRMQNEFPGVRVIIMSGGGNLGTSDLLDIATTLGARAALAKPISHPELRAAIAKVLA